MRQREIGDKRPAHDQAEHREHPPGVVELTEAIRHLAASRFGAYWKAEAYTFTANQARQIVGTNPARLRVQIFVDGGSAGPVWVSSGPWSSAPLTDTDRPGGIQLSPGTPTPLELFTTGEIHVYAPAAALVYVTEEYAQ